MGALRPCRWPWPASNTRSSWCRGCAGTPRFVMVCDPAGKLRMEAFFCTDLEATPVEILHWVVMRWSVEVTFEEARAHLGLETQRQWSDQAIARTTPALLALFSLVTLLAHQSARKGKLPIRQATWYTKQVPTFSNALAVVRQTVWQQMFFSMCSRTQDTQKIAQRQIQR